MTHPVPAYVNPIQWHQAVAMSREICARVFRDGGSPTDAVIAFRPVEADDALSWERAVDLIASEICAHPVARAA
jgi:hypothetical protein